MMVDRIFEEGLCHTLRSEFFVHLLTEVGNLIIIQKLRTKTVLKALKNAEFYVK